MLAREGAGTPSLFQPPPRFKFKSGARRSQTESAGTSVGVDSHLQAPPPPPPSTVSFFFFFLFSADMLCSLLLLSLSAAGVELYAQPPLYAARSELPEDAILVANNGIRVPLGRAVFVDPVDDLVLQTRPGDACSLTVLDHDPLARRPGRLSPEKFPCDFGPGDVAYTHYGAESPPLDRVRLQLRYDAPAETVVIPLVIEVRVDFTPLEVLTKNTPLSVTRPRGTSDAVDGEILAFTFDREVYACQAVSLAGRSALPRYGRLLDGGKPFRTADCDRLTRADIRYRHTFRGPSPDRDRVPMAVELRDREGTLVKREHFQLTVHIGHGRENTAPRPSLAASMTMEVSQFAMTALTPEMLAAEDAEADPGDLAFNVTSPLSYEEGYMVSTDDQNLPVTSFYQRDLRDLKIAYKPPSLDAHSERIFQLEFEAVDPEGAASDPFVFTIVVKPLNPLAPAVTRNAGQLLYEGQSRPLVTGGNLEIADEDDPEAVWIAAVGGLRHGILLVRGRRGHAFAAADLAAGAVAYRHDGSDTHSDNIVFRVTDGKHRVEFLFPVTVVPTDDEPPVVGVNAGLVLSERRMASVSPLALAAVDVDSDDAAVRFTVVPPYSAVGALLLRQSDAPADPSSWKFNSEDDVYEKEVREWLQRDITEGRLFYKHVGPRNTDTVTDRFVFTLRDDNDPPNESGRATFEIRVLPVDTVPPELHSESAVGVGLRLGVPEGGKNAIGPQHLNVNNLELEDGETKDLFGARAHSTTQQTLSCSFCCVARVAGGDKRTGQRSSAERCRISLEKDSYVVGEGDVFVEVLLRRRGYLGHTSFVGIATRDGSAEEDRDFRGVPRGQVRFDPGQTGASWRVRILADGEYERAETFQILLSEPVMATLEFPAAATVEILDPRDDVASRRAGPQRVAHVEVPSDNATERTEAFAPYPEPDDNTADVGEAHVTFPSRPHVLSLLHYDRPAAADPQPPAGYPVICVTACNARHPDYEKTGSACVGERIDDAQTRYHWLVGAPAGPAGVAAPMRVLDLDTFFTSSEAITLDSIYFQAGWRVQCAARAVDSNGDQGPELSSPIVTISREEGQANIIHVALNRFKRPSAPDGAEAGEPTGGERAEGAAAVAEALLGVLLLVLTGGILTLAWRSGAKCDIGRERGRRDDEWETVKGSLSSEPILVVRMQRSHDGYVV
ncbi:LOW QUALITY PROTEIN: FRAS1-related extracellular matrix protein 2-like [Hippocampus zosterae]|uniref:LOW QUALITY PROTEIN: FRAS1-related extracellular matrix protein 2-like n=1 Tax=Hippocampus zosterae TaxID=109293 RepID=UPI00223D4E8A|nr:LOW QUALITY PROTEIN: FRAS1-related extracellular matrix protein 2-like [Hippocampus zosterae]